MKENKEVKAKQRDYSVDLIRIFACLSVIATHVSLQVLNQCYNRIDWSRLLEKSFLTEGVPLFFMITGFFIANGRSFLKIIKGNIKKVLLPSFIYVIFTQIFYPFLVNQDSFINCLKAFNVGTSGIVKAILLGNVTYLNDLCRHLWYIFSHIKIILCFPVLWLLCKDNDESKLARRTLLGLAIADVFIFDIQKIFPLETIGLISIFSLIPRELIYVLLGYELSLKKDKIKNNKKARIISLISLVILNLIRYRIEMFYMVLNYFVDISDRVSFMEWRYTSINIFTGLAAFTFIYSFTVDNVKLNKIIGWLSNKTFGVYLIHYLILAKIDLYQFEKIEKMPLEIIYLVLGTIITFILSVIIVYIIQKIIELCESVIGLIGRKEEVIKE